MAKIPILGELHSVTADGILANADEIEVTDQRLTPRAASLTDVLYDIQSSGGGGSGQTFWFGTRAAYNALETIDPSVCYCIEEGT